MSRRLPKILFKYVGADGALNILEGNRLRFSAALMLNDPLEFAIDRFAIPSPEVMRPALEQRLQSIARCDAGPAIVRRDNISESVLDIHARAHKGESIDSHVQELSDVLCCSDVRPRWEELSLILSGCKVCSMTETPDCPAMWSHYAQSFCGAAVGFDSLRLGGEGCSPDPVHYSDVPDDFVAFPVHEWVDYMLGLALPNRKQMEIRTLLTKPTRYRYEREWRYTAVPADARATLAPSEAIYVPIDISSIKVVILGCRMDTAVAKSIHQVIKNQLPHVEIKQARASVRSPSRVEMVPLSTRTW